MDIEDRIKALEASAAKNDETFSALTTDNDALRNRLTIAENTIAAISDAVKAITTGGDSEEIAAVKTAVNSFYGRVFGDVLFPVSE